MFDANEKKKKKESNACRRKEHDGLELRANDEILCSAEPNEWRSNDFWNIEFVPIEFFIFIFWSEVVLWVYKPLRSRKCINGLFGLMELKVES